MKKKSRKKHNPLTMAVYATIESCEKSPESFFGFLEQCNVSFLKVFVTVIQFKDFLGSSFVPMGTISDSKGLATDKAAEEYLRQDDASEWLLGLVNSGGRSLSRTRNILLKGAIAVFYKEMDYERFFVEINAANESVSTVFVPCIWRIYRILCAAANKIYPRSIAAAPLPLPSRRCRRPKTKKTQPPEQQKENAWSRVPGSPKRGVVYHEERFHVCNNKTCLLVLCELFENTKNSKKAICARIKCAVGKNGEVPKPHVLNDSQEFVPLGDCPPCRVDNTWIRVVSVFFEHDSNKFFVGTIKHVQIRSTKQYCQIFLEIPPSTFDGFDVVTIGKTCHSHVEFRTKKLRTKPPCMDSITQWVESPDAQLEKSVH